jgi:TonB family protein
MKTPNQPLQTDHVYRVLEERHAGELRFRSAVISSTAAHVAATLAVLLGPFFMPKPVLLDFTPVNLVSMQAPEPEPAAAPVVEETPPAPTQDPEPEPPPPVVEDVPEDLEAQRRKEAEEAARQREEERREREAAEARREEAEARRKAAEEAERRRLEEEERRRREQPQTATRSSRDAPPQQTTQQAARGQVELGLTDPSTNRAVSDLPDFWINALLTNIGSKWDPPARPAGAREILTIVHFVVGRNGRVIAGPDIRSSSGDRRYDDAALRAVEAGQPFPPLPQAYRGTSLGINLGFRPQ